MNTKNLTPFLFGTKVTSRRPPRPEMVLILRATYLIVPGEPLALPEGGRVLPQGSMTAETYREDDEERAGECLYPGDFADWKPRAEVMLRGTCHTPFGKPLPECPVRFEVGKWSKVLRVVGRRFWSDDLPSAVMSEPAPFTKMALDYASAFGGAGYARNPVGKGSSGRELPNVEHAGRVIRARRDDPGPAGFGPLSPSWPDRAGKMGKEYGARWRKERWPYYAEDFDWSHFNAAPLDQQLDGYLRGDEALLFQNLHPTAQVIETRLPGLRIRAFVKDVRQRFREVAMSLDTLFADLGQGKLYLTWRGLDPIEADDMKDVATVLVASERLDEPQMPEAHYRGRLEAFEADPLEIRDRVPAELSSKLEAVKQRRKDREEGRTPAHAAPAPDPMTAAVRNLLDLLPVEPSFAEEIESDTADAVAKMIEHAGPPANAKGPSPEIAAELPAIDVKAKIAEEAGELNKSLAGLTALPAVPLRPGGPPPAWAAKALTRTFDAFKEAKKALAEQKLAEKLPAEEAKKLDEQMKKLDEEVFAFEEEPFFAKIVNRPAPVEPGPGKDLSGQDYEGRDLRGADLSGAILCEANLAGAILRGAKLERARLDGAVLVGADLTGADFTGADLTLANLSSASAKGAVFREAKLDRAFFHKADLSGAVLAGAKGEKTILAEADLSGLDGRGLSLDQAFARKANLARADLSGATLTGCHFLDADAKKANLTRASLTRTSFQGADLSGASLAEAKGDRSVWLRAKLHEASFERAVLPNAHFTEVTAERASFRRAILREARCYRASFQHCDFTEANLVSADLSKCALSRARFTGANLFDAKLRQAAGEGVDFSGANLKRAILEET